MPRQENKWLNWLGYTSYPKLENCKTCGAIFGVVLALLALTLVFAFFITLAQFLHAIWDFDNGTQEDVRNIGLILAAMIGFPFIVWRAIVAHRQAETAQQDLITDRINKAVENLGATRNVKKKELISTFGNEITPEGEYDVLELTEPNLEVRIGGIIALERVAQDSPRDHIQIMEILTAYVRKNSPALHPHLTIGLDKQRRPRIDIQSVLTVIGRRSARGKELERHKHFRLDLRGTNLTKANFAFGDFSGVDFMDSIIEGADFSNATLRGTQFQRCHLDHTDFWKAKMVGVSLDRAIITKVPRLNFLNEDNVGPVSLIGADLSCVRSPHIQLQRIATMGDADTKLPKRSDIERLKTMGKREEVEITAFRKDEDPDQAIRNFMISSPFRFWSPYDSSDGVTWQMRHEFLKHHGLLEWPYIDP